MMTNKENYITEDILDLVAQIKSKTDNLDTTTRIPEQELDGLISNINELSEKAYILKFLNQNIEEISDIFIAAEVEELLNEELEDTLEKDSFESEKSPIVSEEMATVVESMPSPNLSEEVETILETPKPERAKSIFDSFLSDDTEEEIIDNSEEKTEINEEFVAEESAITEEAITNDFSEEEVIDLVIDDKLNALINEEELEEEQIEVSSEKVAEKIEQDLEQLEVATFITNEQHANSAESIVEKIQQTPITDIKTGMGLNEKFQYINTIFEGNSATFETAVEKINKAHSLDEALEILSVYDIDIENTSVQNFVDLINRKFL